MLGFLIVLIKALVVAVAIVVVAFGIKWLKNYITQKLKEKKEYQKFAFVHTEDVLTEEFKKKIESTEEMTLEELEKICEEKPYVAVFYDPDTEDPEICDAIIPEKDSEDVKKVLRKNEGILLYD